MSHYTVLVIGENVDEQLAPYDENIEVEEYHDYLIPRMVEGYREMFAEERGAPPATLDELASFLNERYEDEEKYFVDEQGLYRLTTYNPHSKWDWYVVGGRWTGYFKLKPEAMDSPETVAELGRPGTFGNEPRYDADHTLKKYIDIEGMRDLAGARAADQWDRAQAVIGELPEALSWQQMLAKHTPVESVVPEVSSEVITEGGGVAVMEFNIESPPNVEAAREEYHAQPRMKAIQEHDQRLRQEDRWDECLLGFSDGVEQYQVTREAYIQDARDSALATYAYVKDGEWCAPGEMGWWGMSTDGSKERRRFWREFSQMLDELPDDTLLTVVDAHI